VTARGLFVVDAAGCAVAAVVAFARGGWEVGLVLAVAAVDIALLTLAAPRWRRSALRAVAAGNVAWAAGVVAAVVASWAGGTDALLLGLTVPWTLALAAMQARAADGHLVASEA
jgi:hypothetical protein